MQDDFPPFNHERRARGRPRAEVKSQHASSGMQKTRDRARAGEIPRPGLSRSTRRLINTILFCNRTSASAGSPVLLECSLLASVAQGIEHRSPKAGVDGSNPPGGTSEHDGVAQAAPFLVCEPNRRIRAVDTRATIFPRVSFSNPPGGTSEHDGVAQAAPFLVCEPNRRIRAVDTRATIFPRASFSTSA